MKKIYTMMAAVATTLTMVAAPAQQAHSPKLEKTAISDMAFPIQEFSVLDPVTRAAATPDLNNYMAYSYVSLAENNGGETYESIQLEKISDTEVIIYGLCFNYGVKATYNAARQTLTVSSQDVFPAEEWDGEEPLKLYVLQLQVSEDGKITGMPEVGSTTWTYAPNGVEDKDGKPIYEGGWIYDSPYTLLYFATPSLFAQSRGYAFNYVNIFYQLDELFPEAGTFTFNANEWTNIGNSSFFDGWFVGSGEEYSPELCWDVVTYRNNADPNVYLLYQPYGPNSLASQGSIDQRWNQSPNAEGYIYIDANEPDCVLVRPNVYSGLTNEYIFDSNCMIELTSYEGIQYYFDGFTIEDIIDDADFWGDELATLKDGVITIPRCRFGYVPDLAEENYWIESRDNPIPVEMRAVIKLPGEAGIDGIQSDINTPVKYFNLQGVEINNPEKGQIVIKKQGKDVSKVISR